MHLRPEHKVTSGLPQHEMQKPERTDASRTQRAKAASSKESPAHVENPSVSSLQEGYAQVNHLREVRSLVCFLIYYQKEFAGGLSEKRHHAKL